MCDITSLRTVFDEDNSVEMFTVELALEKNELQNINMEKNLKFMHHQSFSTLVVEKIGSH